MSLASGLDDIPGWDSAAAKEPSDLVGDAIKKEKLLRYDHVAYHKVTIWLTFHEQRNHGITRGPEESVTILTQLMSELKWYTIYRSTFQGTDRAKGS